MLPFCRIRPLALAVLSLAGFTACAETPDPRITEAIRQTLSADHTPSAQVAVVQNGRITYSRTFGLAQLSPGIAATNDTRYQLASLSKTFTAQAVLLLEAEGKLHLDDKLSRWFPQVTQADQITLRQVLTHTAGLPEFYPVYAGGRITRPITPDQIIAEWGRHPLLSAPGTAFHYSNTDYVIAGRIVELASGQPLFTYLQQHIFQPAGMTHTLDLDMLAAAPEDPRVATGYLRIALAPPQPAPPEGPGWSFGAGQTVTTAEDVARWDQLFLADRLLPPAQAREETTPAPNSTYSPGLFVSTRDGITTYEHTGQGLGYLAVNKLYPATQTAIVILTNTSSALTFAHILNRLEYLLIPPAAVDARARALFTTLQQGRPDRSLLSSDFNSYLNAAMVHDYQSSLAPLGPVQTFTLLRASTADGTETRTYEAATPSTRLHITSIALPSGLIEEFDIRDSSERE